MVVQLNEQLIHQLEGIAAKKQRKLDDILQEAVERYVEQETRADQFDGLIDRLMQENAWLLNELAKQ